ncbi:MAG: isoprenyl transferase [Bacteroidales bacterium]|nr:isoprenyl transferase [Bacteroidales bacterium]
MKYIDEIDRQRVPRHIAIIMDGNGRWAQRQEHARIYGHQHALEAVRQSVEAAAELGVEVLTLYTFSTENWNRPKEEVDGLMALIVKAVHEETPLLQKNGVKLCTIGDIQRLPDTSRTELEQCIADTSSNSRITLVLALSYSGRWELTQALKAVATEVAQGRLQPQDITEDTMQRHLVTSEWPDPDLLIRTGGEQRISNFLLWQSAYTEFYFSEQLWPDFRKEDLYEAVLQYQQRQRRFGKTGDQVASDSGQE